MAFTRPFLVVDAFAGVTTTFVKAVTAFNEQNLRDLEHLLADDVLLYKVKNGTPIAGKQHVMKYLEDDVMTDKPIFAPVTTVLHPATLPTSVRGTALWDDDDNGNRTILPIQYEFHFQPKAPYLVTSLWATQD